MKTRRIFYGSIGFLSLLGFIGIFTEQRLFLGFFAFAVDFEYFFIKSDEMLEAYMNRSASMAFFCGMITTAVVALASFFAGSSTGNQALLAGIASGWAVSVVVYALSTAWYGFREKWGLRNDQE